MSDTPLAFGPDIAPVPVDVAPIPADSAAVDTAPKRGRPKKYASEAERKEARNARDRARKARKPEGGAAKASGDPFADELAALQAGYKETKPTDAPSDTNGTEATDAPKAANEKAYISGYMLLLVTDALFPPLLGFMFRRDTSGLRLTEDERKRLEPVADAAAADVLGSLTPAQLFMGTAFALYAAKVRSLPKLPPKQRKSK